MGLHEDLHKLVILSVVGRGCGSPVETSAYESMQKRNRASRRDLAPAVFVRADFGGRAMHAPTRLRITVGFVRKFNRARVAEGSNPYGLRFAVGFVQNSTVLRAIRESPLQGLRITIGLCRFSRAGPETRPYEV